MGNKLKEALVAVLFTLVLGFTSSVNAYAGIEDYWTPDSQGENVAGEGVEEEVLLKSNVNHSVYYKSEHQYYYDRNTGRLLFELWRDYDRLLCELCLYNTEKGTMVKIKEEVQLCNINEDKQTLRATIRMYDQNQIQQEEFYVVNATDGFDLRRALYYDYYHSDDGNSGFYRSDGSAGTFDENGNLLNESTYGHEIDLLGRFSELTEYKMTYNSLDDAVSDGWSKSFVVYDSSDRKIAAMRMPDRDSGYITVTYNNYGSPENRFSGDVLSGCWIEENGKKKTRKMLLIDSTGKIIETEIDTDTGIPLIKAVGTASYENGTFTISGNYFNSGNSVMEPQIFHDVQIEDARLILGDTTYLRQ